MYTNYVAIKQVSNGFTVDLNEYSVDKSIPRKSFVAKDAGELHKIIADIFPADPRCADQPKPDPVKPY